MTIDLHTHTNHSDGDLTPAELLRRAAAAGVEMLAITDHDCVSGSLSAAEEVPAGIRLVPGIELSTTWRKLGIHVLGLGIDPLNPTLQTGIAQHARARSERAELIAAKLAKAGFTDTLAGARQLAAGDNIGRPHFARFLVASGQIKDVRTAFKRFLGRGKPCDIRSGWATLHEVIGWIEAAGGLAVLAHPAKYRLSNLRLEELAREFREAGGHGIEVVSGAQEQTLTNRLGRLAERHGLLASCGSDFHTPGQAWADVGRVQALPEGCKPVWAALG